MNGFRYVLFVNFERTNFAHGSGVSMVDFEQVNAGLSVIKGSETRELIILTSM